MILWRGLSLVALVAVVAGPAAAGADTFKPTRFDDPPPGKCKPNNCSLREAITRANTRDGPDRVVLGAGRYEMELPDDATDDNENGDFDVSGEVLIRGKGAQKTTVDGQGVHRVFQFLTFPPHTLKGVTVRGGLAPDSGAGVFSGPSPLTLTDVVIKRNEAVVGAGLRAVSPELRLRRVTVAKNEASGNGGGVHLGVSVVDTQASIRDSTISGNFAEGDGGGLAADETDTISEQNQLDLTVVNSTVDGNEVDDDGGGVAALAGATVNLDNVTVAHNRADDDISGVGNGGGIFVGGAIFEVNESIIAANTDGAGTSQCFGSFAGARNVLSAPPGCMSFPDGPNEIVNNPKIGLLANNGGPTRTVRLRAGSAALGLAVDCPKRDQRGEPRPAQNCDAGAFERKGP
jgi:predicted outer membrane repeat protein